MRSISLIMIMFAVVLLALGIIHGVSSYYGADWTWISEQIAGFFLIFMVIGLALFTLTRWLGRK